MRSEQTRTVRELNRARQSLRRAQTTKQMHQRLLRALGDRRLKRTFGG